MKMLHWVKHVKKRLICRFVARKLLESDHLEH